MGLKELWSKGFFNTPSMVGYHKDSFGLKDFLTLIFGGFTGMFREYVDLINESVNEGTSRGVQLFLENLNQDMVIDEVFEELGGSDATIKQIFTENGYEVTDLEPIEEVKSETETEIETETVTEDEDAFDKKLDSILEQLKKEGVVD